VQPTTTRVGKLQLPSSSVELMLKFDAFEFVQPNTEIEHLPELNVASESKFKAAGLVQPANSHRPGESALGL